MAVNITIINMFDGSVHAHKTGCPDIKRAVTNNGMASPMLHGDSFVLGEFDNARDVYLEYNADFIAESGEEDGHYDIVFAPCVKFNNSKSTTTTKKETTMSSTTTEFLFAAARDAYSTLRREKGQRAQSVLQFLNAETDEERDWAIDEWRADYIRRGLREAAVAFTDGTDEGSEVAAVFWALRETITLDGYVDFEGGELEEAV